MPSVHDQSGFSPAHVRAWAQDEKHSINQPADYRRQSLAVPETLRPMEPFSSGPRPYMPTRLHSVDSGRQGQHGQQRQQLPGLQELLSPSMRPGPPSPFPNNWPSVNGGPPSTWQEGPSRSHVGQPTRIGPMPVNPTPPPFHRLSLDVSQQSPSISLGARPSISIPPPPPPPPKLSDILGPRSVESASYQQPAPRAEIFNPSYSQSNASLADDASDRTVDRRMSTTHDSRKAPSAGNYSLQCVGQRQIPGEGLCYVFKDGSICPTVIDGEPVNPLWGTTKAGKARKRLAQACLNCREKKIKCEPGESSCLQCEKAKRECQKTTFYEAADKPPTKPTPRSSAPQLQSDLANSASLQVLNPPLGRAEWSSQSSGSVAVPEAQAQKRRRSAQAAQQDVLHPATGWSRERSPQSVKRRKSDVSASSVEGSAIERQRKDSKRADLEEVVTSQLSHDSRDPTSWDEDPYQIDPEGTMRFLELFFAQSAREVSILFPRRSFTNWVRHCREKCQRECMVMYALLALGSTFAANEFSSFAKICSNRATQAVSRVDGKFSLALIQTRLLVSIYYHLNGKDSMGWDFSGGAFRIISALRLNTEEGCGEDLDEYARPYFSFKKEQLRECRRRTFWTAFLIDRYHGFRGGLLCTIQCEDIQIRLPCSEQIYEDGLPSEAPLFDHRLPSGGLQHHVGVTPPHSATAYTLSIASLWTEVIKLIHRPPLQHVAPGGYVKTYESYVDDVQARLLEWRNNLPPHLYYSRQTLVESIQHGYAGSLVTMYALYHISQIKSARNVHHELLTAGTVSRQIRTAYYHSSQLLEIVCDLRSSTPQGSGKAQDPVNLLSPFFAYGITAAIDTLSAGGSRDDYGQTMTVINDSVATLHDLAQFCASARTQAKQTSKRMAQVEMHARECFEATAVAAPRAMNKATGNFWRIAEPMEKQFSRNQDVCYGSTDAVFFSALQEGR